MTRYSACETHPSSTHRDENGEFCLYVDHLCAMNNATRDHEAAMAQKDAEIAKLTQERNEAILDLQELRVARRLVF